MKLVIILITMACSMLTAIDILENYNFNKNIKIFTFFIIPLIFLHYNFDLYEFYLQIHTSLKS